MADAVGRARSLRGCEWGQPYPKPHPAGLPPGEARHWPRLLLPLVTPPCLLRHPHLSLLVA